MKKKKTIIILLMVSILIYASAFLVAVLEWVLEWMSSNYSYDYDSLFAVASIPTFIINIIPIIWFVYIIIFLTKKKKGNSFKIWYLVIILIMIVLSTMSVTYFRSLVNRKHINYQDSNNTYHIYKIGNRIELLYDNSKFIQCWNDVCPFTVSRESIKFSSKNMKSINKFIDSLFKNKKSNYLELSDPKLSKEGLRIIKSIINNDEAYLYDTSQAYVSITYKDINDKEYKIEKNSNSNKITVTFLEQVQCIKAPCEPVKYKREVNFSKENMEIVSKTLKNMIKSPEYIEVEVFDKDLTSDQKRVIKAIISNDESLLKTIDN